MDSYPVVADRFRTTFRVAIVVVATVAVVAIVARILGVDHVMQVLPTYPAMEFNTSVGIAMVALALVGVARRRRVLTASGGAVALAIGAATLIEYISGRDLWLDTIVVGPVAPELPFPGRMSAALALSFVMVGCALLEVSMRRRRLGAPAVAGILGSITATIAVVVLFSYATNVLSGLRFGYVMSMSIPGAFAMIATGVALVLIGWRQPSTYATFPTWVPIGAGVSVLVATMLLSGAMSIAEQDAAMAQVRAQATAVQHRVSEQIDNAFAPLTQLGSVRRDTTGGASPEWLAAAASILQAAPATEGVVLFDANLGVRSGVPDVSWSRFDRVTVATLLAGWSQSDRGNRGRFITLTDAGARPLLFAVVPACAVTCDGYIAALMHPARFLAPNAGALAPGYVIEVSAHDRAVYLSPGTHAGREWGARSDTVIAGIPWTVRAWPQPATLAALVSDVAAVLAGLGFMVGALLTSTLKLVQNSVGAARLSERERIATAIESLTEGIWETNVLTGEGRRSEGLWRSLGYDPADISSAEAPRLWQSLIHPDDRTRVAEATSDHVAGASDAIACEYRIKGHDSWHWMIDRGRVVEHDDRNRVMRLLGTVSDVTERKLADERLATSERQFRAVFDSGFQFETLLDLDCSLLQANHTSLEFAGITLDAVHGHKFWDTPWWSHSAEAAERLREACREAAMGKTVQYQDEVRGRNDRRALIDFSLKPILDAEGHVVQLLAEGRDITERKRAEDSLREVDTIGTIGRMAARVAHEINNPLAGIQNSFLLIKDAVPETHKYYAYVGAIEREIARIAAVTRQLYEAFRPETDGTPDSAVAVVISDAVAMLSQINRASQVNVEVDTSEAAAVVAIPSPLLRQAVYNLVQNAVEASPPTGTVWVKAWCDSKTFWLTVRDQGPGVPPDMRERIFEPFVTSKTRLTTGGMGLGLALVRRSIQAMGGGIEVQDAPGGGAEFRVSLPLT